jgi:uncharacterized membrane protein
MLQRLCPQFYGILCGGIYVFHLYSLLLIYLLLLFIVVCFFSSHVFIRLLRHKLTTATESLQKNTNGRKIERQRDIKIAMTCDDNSYTSQFLVLLWTHKDV